MTDAQKIKHPVSSNYRHFTVYQDARERYNRSNVLDISEYNLVVNGLVSPHSCYLKASQVKQHSLDYLVGVEIEAEGLNGSYEQKIDLSSILNDTIGHGNYYICTDGSLNSSGFEIVTYPRRACELGYSKFAILLKNMQELGYQSHNGGRCGLHISVTKSVLSNEEWRAVQHFINKNKKFFLRISRREAESSYALFQTSTSSKYCALNLSKSAVAEFRFFRGTLLSSSFVASIDIVKSLIDYAIVSFKANKKLTAPKFRKWIEQYKIAYKYSAPHLDLLHKTMPRKERIKYTAEEREKRRIERHEHQKNKARDEILYLLNRNYSTLASMVDGNGCLHITSYVVPDTVINHNGSLVPMHEADSTDKILESSVRLLPPRIQQLIQRADINSISVTYSARVLGALDKRLTNSPHYAWHYSQGGWGRPSKLYLTLTMRRD